MRYPEFVHQHINSSAFLKSTFKTVNEEFSDEIELKINYLKPYHDKLSLGLIESIVAISFKLTTDNQLTPNAKLIISDFIRFFKSPDDWESIHFKNKESLIVIMLDFCYKIKNNEVHKHLLSNKIVYLLTSRLIPIANSIRSLDAINCLLEFPIHETLSNLRNSKIIPQLGKIEEYKWNQIIAEKDEVFKWANDLKNAIRKSKEVGSQVKNLNFTFNAFLINDYFDTSEGLSDLEPFHHLDIILEPREENHRVSFWQTYTEITDLFQPFGLCLRDWVSNPRDDGYEALHTTVMTPYGQWIHCRIRREEGLILNKSKRINIESFGSTFSNSIELRFSKINRNRASKGHYSLSITSFEDFFNNIMQLQELALEQGYFILFRGQVADFKLIPSLARLSFKSIPELLNHETKIFEEFRDLGYNYFDKSLSSKLEMLAICQHHGLPTRLLDWSENPLVSLWFACNKNNGFRNRKGVVWCLFVDPENIVEHSLDPFKINQTSFYKPKHLIDRIQAQSGWFSIHPMTTTPFQPLEENKYSLPLVKLTIKSNLKHEFSTKLNYMNVNDYTVMKDLDGLASWIKNKSNY